jgi:hypothetical protein
MDRRDEPQERLRSSSHASTELCDLVRGHGSAKTTPSWLPEQSITPWRWAWTPLQEPSPFQGFLDSSADAPRVKGSTKSDGQLSGRLRRSWSK